MSKGLRRAAEPGWSEGFGGGRWSVGVGLGVALLAFLCGLTGLWEADTFYHFAAGRDLVRRGAFPVEDPFLFPLEGHAVGPMPYWLGSLLVYGSTFAGGETGAVLLVGLLTFLLSWILWADARGESGGSSRVGIAVAAAVVLLGLAVFRERTAARPETFGAVFLAATLLAIRRFGEGHRGWLVGFPFLALVWSNVHPSVILGVGAVGVYAAVEAVRSWSGRDPRPSRAWVQVGAIAVAGLVASAVNPSPANPLAVAVQFAKSLVGPSGGGVSSRGGGGGSAEIFLRQVVNELQPVPMETWLGPLGLLVALAALSLALSPRRDRWWEAVVVLGFFAAALSARRFVGLLAVVCAPIAARNVVAMALPWTQRAWARRLTLAGALAVAAFALWRGTTLKGYRFSVDLEAEHFPVRAVEYMRSNGISGAVYNTFHFGGFMEWRLDQKVFQDGRGGLPGGDAEAIRASPFVPGAFERLDEKYRFSALVVKYPSFDPKTLELLRRHPGAALGLDRSKWSLVAFDDGAMLFLRREGPWAKLARRDEFRFAAPEVPYSEGQVSGDERSQGFVADYERALGETPGCRVCRVRLGLGLLTLGRTNEAERVLEPALGRSDGIEYTALKALGQAAEARRDRAAARRYYQRALRLDVDPLPARRALAFLDLEEGDVSRARKRVQDNLAANPESRDDLVMAIDLARRTKRASEIADLVKTLLRTAGTSGARELCGTAFDYEAAGEPGQAREFYESCLVVEPEGADAARAKQRLDALRGEGR